MEPLTTRRSRLILAAALTVLACKDAQAPPPAPTMAGQFQGAADVDHGFYGFLSQLPVTMSLQQDESLLSGSLQLGTTTFTLSGTANLNSGNTTLRLSNAVAAGGSPSPCSGYELNGSGQFNETMANLGSGPLVLTGQLTGTDCNGTMTVTFDAQRQ